MLLKNITTKQIPSRDCVYKILVKLGTQGGISDQPQPKAFL